MDIKLFPVVKRTPGLDPYTCIDPEKFHPMLRLPWEDVLFSHILPYLDWQDFRSLASTNHQFGLMLIAYYNQLKCVDTSKINYYFKDEFKYITAECRNVRKLVLPRAYWLEDSDLIPVLKRNPLLSHLDLSECQSLKGTCLLALGVNCKRVKTLLLQDCTWLSAGAMESLITHLDSLEVVDMSSCSALSNQQLLPFLQKFYKLKELHVANLQVVNDTTLLVLARSCGQFIQVLDIRGCGNVTDRGVRMIAEYCTKLSFLYAAHCTLVTEDSLQLFRARGVQVDREVAGALMLYVPLPVQV